MTNSHLNLALSTVDAALAAVDPERCVRRALELDGDHLRVGGARHAVHEGIVGLAVGKAAQPMLRALADVAGERWLRGLAIGKHPDRVPRNSEQVLGDHPVPGDASFRAAIRAEKFVRAASADELLVLLVSGGGSALMTAPVLDLTIDKVSDVTATLLEAGVSIDELNTVRRRLDRLKGGGLGAMVNGRPVALVLSDVIGDDLAAIASGPFVDDPTTAEEATAILQQADVEDVRVIHAVHNLVPRTPVPIPHHIVGNVKTAVDAAAEYATNQDWTVEIIDVAIQGEARDVGAAVARRLRDYDGPTPAMLLGGGETTVTVTGDGHGGRNLEVALGAVEPLDGCENALLLTFATDGEDGPTDAAGAWVDGEIATRANEADLDPADFLRRNDAYHFFDALEALVKRGPTGTNVNDLVVGLRW